MNPLVPLALMAVSGLLLPFVSTAATPPVIQPIADVQTSDGVPVERIPIVLQDDASDPSGLVVEVRSANTGILSGTAMLIEGVGWTRWLSLYPGTATSGEPVRVAVTVTVTDEENLHTSRTFTLSVVRANVPLGLGPVAPQRFWQQGPRTYIPVRVQSSGFTTPSLSASSSDPALFPRSSLVFEAGRTSSTNWLVVTPPETLTGVCTITLTANLGGEVTTTSFPVVVDPAPFLVEPITNVLTNPLRGALSWVSGDLDGEDGMDLVVLRSDEIVVYLKRGDRYVAQPGLPGSWTSYELATTDLDQDGYPDLVAYRLNELKAWVSRRVEGGAVTLIPLAVRWAADELLITDLALGDFDGDGAAEVLLASPGSLVLLKNQGGRLAARPVVLSAAVANFSPADADGDGDIDLLVHGQTPAVGVSVWLNNGRGIFTMSGPSLVSPFTSVIDMGWADWDGDGKAEPWISLASPGIFYPMLTTFQRGPGSWVAATTTRLSSRGRRGVGVADVDADGHEDLVLGHVPVLRGTDVSVELALAVAFGDGRGQFPHTSLLSATAGMDRVGFLSGADGRLDIGNSQRWLRNTTRYLNPPPGVPSGLVAEVIGTRVRFSWGESADLNQSSGLTYNLRVGTTRGGHEVVSALADSRTGARRVLAPGNRGAVRSVELDLGRVARGPLYWSVQAVDAGLTGGAFASERVVPTFPGEAPNPNPPMELTLGWAAPVSGVPLLTLSTRVETSQVVLLERSSNLIDWAAYRWVQPAQNGVVSLSLSPRGEPMGRAFFRARVEDAAVMPAEADGL